MKEALKSELDILRSRRNTNARKSATTSNTSAMSIRSGAISAEPRLQFHSTDRKDDDESDILEFLRHRPPSSAKLQSQSPTLPLLHPALRPRAASIWVCPCCQVHFL